MQTRQSLDADSLLREVLAADEEIGHGGAANLGEIRARRDELNAEIGQTEKLFEEAERLLGGPQPSGMVAVG